MSHLQVESRDGRCWRVPITSGVFRIGKTPENHLALNVASISRQHCEIRTDNGRAVVCDLGSRNGTYVEGARVEKERVLKSGERIQLGEYTITYLDETAPPAAPLPHPAVPTAPPVAEADEVVIPPDLRRSLHQDLLKSLDLKRLDVTKMSAAELRRKTEEAVQEVVQRRAREIPPAVPRPALIKDIVDQAVGLGPLEELLKDPGISEIMVNNCDHIYVERRGRIELTRRQFLDNQHVIEVIRRIIAPIGRRIDESSPMVDARLPDGSRVNAIIPPLAVSGPSITIRKFFQKKLGFSDLVGFGTLTENMARFLELCVQNRRNMCISGGTGSGKTTLLNVLASCIPTEERIITIEDSAELRLPQDHVVSLESKTANIEGEGAIPIRKLVINALRMRPDRIIVGECRGGEALDMLQAMNTGHDGSLTTLHANTCRDAIARLETMVLMAGMELPSKAILDQIASAIHIIVQTSRFSDGTRRVTHITAVVGKEGDVITLQDVFKFKQTGVGPGGKTLGHYEATGTVPEFVHDLRKRGVDTDLAMFRA